MKRSPWLFLPVAGVAVLAAVWLLRPDESKRTGGAVARPGGPAGGTVAQEAELRSTPLSATGEPAAAKAGVVEAAKSAEPERRSVSATRELAVEALLPPGSPPDEALAVHVFAMAESEALARDKEAAKVLRDRCAQFLQLRRVDGPRVPRVWNGSRRLEGARRVTVDLPDDATHACIVLLGRYVRSELVDVVLAGTSAVRAEGELGTWIVGRLVLPPGAERRQLGDERRAVALSTEASRIFGIQSGGMDEVEAPVDEEGRFEFPAVRGEAARLSIVVPGLCPYRGEPLPLEPGGRLDVELVPRLGAVVSGRVLDESGAPVEGARVRLGGFAFLTGAPPDATDAEGAYRLEGVPAGNAKLRVTADRFESLETEPVELADGQELTGFDLVLSSGASLAGVVLWPDGSPAAEVRVSASQPRSASGFDPFDRNQDRTETDAGGRFLLRGLRADACQVEAHAFRNAEDEAVPDPSPADRALSPEEFMERMKLEEKGEHPEPASTEGVRHFVARATAEAGSGAELVLELVAPGPIRGRVVAEDGSPVRAFSVTASPVRTGRDFSIGRQDVSESFESEDGAFVLEGTWAGTWKVDAAADGFAHRQESVRVEVPTEESLEIVLARGLSLTGVVLDPAGQPVPEAEVVGTGPANEDTLTDEEGRFRFRALRAGAWSVHANHEEWADSEPVAVDLRPELPPAELALSLRVGARITGVVYTDEGEPRVGQSVTAGAENFGFGGDGAVTDGQGRFALEHVTPGRVTVVAMPSEDEILDTITRQGEDPSAMLNVMGSMRTATVEVADGEEAHVVLGGTPKVPVRVLGRVREAEGPVPEASIVAVAEGGSPLQGMKAARTDGSGRFELVLDRPGAYVFHVSPGGLGPGAMGAEFFADVPEVETHELDLRLPLGSVSGRVLDPAGEPAPDVDVRVSNSQGILGIGDLDESKSATTDAEGRFRVGHLRPGTYSLRAGGRARLAGEGRAVVTLSDVRVREDEAVEGLELRLRPAGTLVGVVRDASGRPVDGAAIFVRDAAGRPLTTLSSVSTDVGGRFTHPGLPEGEVLVEARTRELVSYRPAVAQVRAGDETRVELELDLGVLLLVTAVLDGEPVRARFRVTDGAGRDAQGLFSQSDLESLFEEGFSSKEQRIGPVPPGEYRITAVAPDGKEASGTYTVRAGRGERKVKLRLK